MHELNEKQKQNPVISKLFLLFLPRTYHFTFYSYAEMRFTRFFSKLNIFISFIMQQLINMRSYETQIYAFIFIKMYIFISRSIHAHRL